MKLSGFYKQSKELVRCDYQFEPIFDFYIRGAGDNGYDVGTGTSGSILMTLDMRDRYRVADMLRQLADQVSCLKDYQDQSNPFSSDDEKERYQEMLANGQYEQVIRCARGDKKILDWIEAYGIKHPNRNN